METKILVILPIPIAVGDLMMLQSLFFYLKQKNPGVIIDVVTTKQTPELITRLPEIRRIIPSSLTHKKLDFMQRYRLGKALRKEKYTQAIVFSTAVRTALVPWFAGIPRRTGYHRRWRFTLLNDTQLRIRPRLPRMISRWLSVCVRANEKIDEEIFWPKISANETALAETLKKFQLTLTPEDKPILALCPGAAGGSSKRWPEHYFIQVAQYFLEKNWTIWCLGGPEERESIARMNAQLSGAMVDLSHTTLLEALDLLSLATVVVANDSGLMHIAAALGKSVVAIYGSGTPIYTPPLTHTAKVLFKDLSCQPCYQRECPLGHTNCLNQIAPQEVIDAVLALTAPKNSIGCP